MKKIIQLPGGRKYFGVDFLLLQENSLLLERMLATYGNIIVHGCVKSGTAISAGVIMLDGELATFDGATEVSGDYYVQAQVSPVLGVYQDDMREAYQVRKAVACASSAEGAFRLDNAARFDDVLRLSTAQIRDFPTSMPASDVPAWAKEASKPTYTASEVGAADSNHTHSELIEQESGTWTPVAEGFTAGHNANQTTIVDSVCCYWQRIGNRMFISGRIEFSAPVAFATIYNLPRVPALEQENIACYGDTGVMFACAERETASISISTHIGGAHMSINPNNTTMAATISASYEI